MNAPALNLLEKRAHQVAYAKALLRELITALEAPEDVRETFLTTAYQRATHALSDRGRLSSEA